MNKKGFTLIELLAVIVILGVIMIIAIPSVTSYITNARKDSYISDAKMFLEAARKQLTADEKLPQASGEKVLIPIEKIALDKGGEKSPYGNEWNIGKSYVIIENIGTSSDPEYVWQVALMDLKGNCIPLTSDKDLKRNVVTTNCEIPSTLVSKISASAKSDAEVNFNDVPTEETSGVYVLNSSITDLNPVYYYRGIVANNNVKFANFCWKIVRTTETGGIKLIYNGVPADDGSCNNTGSASQLANKSRFNTGINDNAYVGYMYGKTESSSYNATHSNNNDSTIKIEIDKWYQENMSEYTLELDDEIWCYDRSLINYSEGTGTGMSKTFYSAYKRVGPGARENVHINLTCKNINDRFTVSTSNGNGALTYPVGLLTADEATLVGTGITGYSTSSYLHTGQAWWFGTPEYFSGSDAVGFYVSSSGYLNVAIVDYKIGVRPSISLKSGTIVISGDGTVSNPYVVE